MIKHRNIFTRKNQAVLELFATADHPKKVLCVVFDYAKITHTALCCDGTGKVLKTPFPVKNNPEGLEHVIEIVGKLCRKHRIERKHVFFGGEDCGTFALNMIYNLRERGFLVVGVNAADAKKQRENHQASTDKLDLLGIANMLVNKRGAVAGGSIGAQRAMRSLTRHRKQQVRWLTATGNRIHQLVDQLFPGFLDERNSAVPPFSEASLYLMEERFSSRQITRRQDKALLKQLKAKRLQHAEQAIVQLKTYAREVLDHPLELSGMLQSSLSCEVRLYRCIQENIQQVSREIAQQLARTPAAVLTSIRGIGITLAAGVSAEIGPVETQPSLQSLCSYAGIVPRVKQTGGPEKTAQIGRVSRRSNRILKDYIVQCGNHLGLHGPADLMEDHRRRSANGQHADFGMARRFLRIAMRLMRTGECYVPPELQHAATIEELREYYLQLWPGLLDKWVKAKAVDTAFDAENPLGQWRNMIQEMYEIELPLPSQK